MAFTNHDKAQCAHREVQQRKRVYRGLVANNRMTNEKANQEVAMMEEIRDEYSERAQADAAARTPSLDLQAPAAPGSAGPGAKERARKRIQALGAAMSRRDWSAAESAYEAIRDAHDRPEVYDAPLLATPSPAQEPGTGDTGEAILARLRSAGWMVAVHNDYRLAGIMHTFWLFTHPDGRWIKGEGASDAEALSRAESCATPATTAETRGPAEGAPPPSGKRWSQHLCFAYCGDDRCNCQCSPHHPSKTRGPAEDALTTIWPGLSNAEAIELIDALITDHAKTDTKGFVTNGDKIADEILASLESYGKRVRDAVDSSAYSSDHVGGMPTGGQSL